MALSTVCGECGERIRNPHPPKCPTKGCKATLPDTPGSPELKKDLREHSTNDLRVIARAQSVAVSSRSGHADEALERAKLLVALGAKPEADGVEIPSDDPDPDAGAVDEGDDGDDDGDA